MYLLFDIGATSMRFATSDGKKLEHVRIMPTPKNYKDAIALFKKAAAGMPKGQIKGVVGGVPFYNQTGLSIWQTNPTARDLARITGAKVTLANDSAMCGLGEAVYGAGKGHRIVAYLTFSTGHGGARITNGRIDESFMGFEPSLQILDYNPRKKTYTSVEDHATGRGLARFKVRPEKLQNKKAWAEVQEWMVLASHNALAFWSPDCLVIGGGIAHNPGAKIDKVLKAIERDLKNFPKKPAIRKSSLKQLSGLYGALALAKQQK